MKFRTTDDFDFSGKIVLMRTDLDVPLSPAGRVSDDTRLRHTAPTVENLQRKGAKQIVIMGHLHRPGGRVVETLRMNPVARQLSKLLDQKVVKLDDCVDIEVPDAKIVLLENTRFHTEEKENYEYFAKKLASHGDVFVMDAFANSHRDHASMTGVMQYLPSCASLSFAKEIEVLEGAVRKPEHPFVAIIGGAKISTKINVIDSLIKKVDHLLLGGAMIFTFYKAKGMEIGKSLYEEDLVKLAGLLLNNDKLVLPTDVVIAPGLDSIDSKVVDVNNIPKNMFGLDIGPETIKSYRELLADTKTVLWNGPMGRFEVDKYAKGTDEIAKCLAVLDGTTIVGGGDSDAALKKLGLTDKMDHVSTGGGASLKILEGKKLPTVAALEENLKRFPPRNI